MYSQKILDLFDELEQNHEQIKKEHDLTLPEDDAKYTPFQNGRSEGEWRQFGLCSVWGHWDRRSAEKYPTITRILRSRVPEATAAGISVLGGNASIKPHEGSFYRSSVYKAWQRGDWPRPGEVPTEDTMNIEPTRGRYYACRFHYGIDVPEHTYETMGLECGEKQYTWENGKTFMFHDWEHHHVWNTTGERRFILIFDIERHIYEEKYT